MSRLRRAITKADADVLERLAQERGLAPRCTENIEHSGYAPCGKLLPCHAYHQHVTDNTTDRT